MMVQSPPPNSINTVFSFAIENQRLNMDSLCDWSNCGGPWQKSHNCDDCSLNNCKESLFTGEEQVQLSDPGIVGCSRTCSDLSAVNNMCASSASKKEGCVYKRRKLQRNAVALLSEENAAKTSKRTSSYHSNVISIEHFSLDVDVEGAPPVGSHGTLYNGNPSISGCHNLEKTSDVSRNLEPVQIALPSLGEDKVPVEMSLSNVQKPSTEDYSSTNDSCSSSRYNLGHGSASVKKEVEEIGECSSSDMVVAEAPGKSSVKDLCISFLKSQGLLGEQWTTGACASELVGVADANCLQSCKICCRLENPLKMLICDLCDDAFHMSCCNPRVKMPPQDDEWFCQSCRRKNLKCVKKSCTGKSSKIAGSVSRKELGPILSMLRDNEQYKSGARTGPEFQAEVPEWSGPVVDSSSYFEEPMELDPAECASLNGWNLNKPHTISNWLQCREVIYKDGSDTEGTVCGKWRRAPLSEVQTDEWDCSCAFVWDEIHADCAVPQELEMDIIITHLKYVDKWRSLLASKQKTEQTRSDDLNQSGNIGLD